MTSSTIRPEPPNQPLPSTTRKKSVRLEVNCTQTAPLSNLGQISPASLAYIGDAVYELYVRTHYLLPPKRLSDYHNQVVAQVRAEQQAIHLQRLEPHLTETEREMVRKGRNAANGRPRRLDPAVYQKATSLETLIGYLYLQNPQRLNELLEILDL